jgi:hypothetical protein
MRLVTKRTSRGLAKRMDRLCLFRCLYHAKVYARIGTFHLALGELRRGEAEALI